MFPTILRTRCVAALQLNTALSPRKLPEFWRRRFTVKDYQPEVSIVAQKSPFPAGAQAIQLHGAGPLILRMHQAMAQTTERPE